MTLFMSGPINAALAAAQAEQKEVDAKVGFDEVMALCNSENEYSPLQRAACVAAAIRGSSAESWLRESYLSSVQRWIWWDRTNSARCNVLGVRGSRLYLASTDYEVKPVLAERTSEMSQENRDIAGKIVTEAIMGE